MQQATIRRSAYIGFTAALLILGSIAYISYKNTEEFLSASGNINHTHEMLQDIDTVTTLIADVEDQSLQYIITGDSIYCITRDSTIKELREQMKELRDSVSGSPIQMNNFDRLEAMLYRIPSLPVASVAPKALAVQSSGAMAIFLHTEHAIMDSIGLLRISMENAQQQLLLDQQAAVSQGAIKARDALQYGTVMTFILLFVIFIFFRRDIARSTTVSKKLASVNQELEEHIQKRTTELQNANEKLKEQYMFNETLLQAENDVGIGIAITLDTKIIYANNALCQILGLTIEEIKNLPNLFVLVIPEEREHLMKILQQNAFASKNFANTDETIIERRNGERVHIEYSAKGVRIGNQTYMFSTVRNITERKEEEERLSHSQESLAEAQRITHIGSWTLYINEAGSTENTPVEWSDEMSRIFGYEPGELAMNAQNFFRILHPDDVAKIHESLRNYLKGGPRFNIDHRIIRPTGEERFLHSEADIHYDAKTGKPIHILGTARDITDEIKLKNQLVQYNEEVKNIMENVDVALMTVDMVTSQPLMLSPAWEKIYGYPLEKFYNDTMLWKKTIHPEDISIVEASEKMLWNGKSVADEYRIIRADGEIRWVEGRIRPTLNEKGELIRIEGYISDITRRKEAEDNIRRSLVEKEVLLKEVHHRVKNNMQVISSMLNLQEEFMQSQHDKNAFHDTQNRIKSMALVHEMLYQSEDIAKIDFDLYVRTIVQQLLESYALHPDAITINIQTNNIHLDVDAAIPCGLIINELVSNALKYAFPNGKEGTIDIVFTKDPAGKYSCIVRDDGIGFSKEVDIKHGSTLGLQLVDALVQQLGGSLDITAEKGTAFSIHFTGQKQRDSALL